MINGYDPNTGVLMVMDYPHHEVHAGSHFFVNYSVADLGAATTPNDMMTISFKTSDTTKHLHWIFEAICASGAVLKLIEGKTGGGATPTGTLQTYNSNRNSSKVSTILDVAGANASKVSYDATAFTGGIELVDEIIGADGLGNVFTAGSSRGDNEIMLKQNTAYQISLFTTANVPGTLKMSWYEHTSRV